MPCKRSIVFSLNVISPLSRGRVIPLRAFGLSGRHRAVSLAAIFYDMLFVVVMIVLVVLTCLNSGIVRDKRYYAML